ncbi:MAG TPA: flippase [Candidatus Acidoferrales bacterium]|nr:flippase [Candidatus Acidoferrales bacterium]
MSLLKNAAWGFSGELVVRVTKIVQVLVLVRWLGAEQYGRFNHALSVASLFGIFFDLGIATVAVREFAKNPRDQGVLLEYGALKVVSSAVGLTLLSGWAWLTFHNGGENRLILLMGFFLWLADFGSYVFVVYRGRQEFWKETAVRAVTSALQLAACILALVMRGDVTTVVAALAVSAGLGLVPLGLEVRRIKIIKMVSFGQLWTPLRECLPMTCTAIVTAVYMNYDIVVLAKHVSMDEIGWYSVAVKTVFGIFIMPIYFFSLASLPALSVQASAAEAAAARARWLGNFARTTLVGALLALGIAVFAKPLIWLAFGRTFAPATPVLVAFTLPCFFFYIYTPLAQWVLIQRRQTWSMAISIGSALLNVALVTWWVPIGGIWGATLAAVVTHAALALGHLRIVLCHADFDGTERDWWAIVRSVVALGAAWLIVEWWQRSAFLAGAAAVAVFCVIARPQVRRLAADLASMARRAWARWGPSSAGRPQPDRPLS